MKDNDHCGDGGMGERIFTGTVHPFNRSTDHLFVHSLIVGKSPTWFQLKIMRFRIEWKLHLIEVELKKCARLHYICIAIHFQTIKIDDEFQMIKIDDSSLAYLIETIEDWNERKRVQLLVLYRDAKTLTCETLILLVPKKQNKTKRMEKSDGHPAVWIRLVLIN